MAKRTRPTLKDRTLYHVRLHAPTIARLVALLGANSPRFPKNGEAIEGACMEVVRIMDDPDYTVQRMSDLNAHVQRQRIEDAQTLAACVGAKMWIHNEPTGMRLEFRKDDAVVGSSFLPDRTFERTDERLLTAKFGPDVTKH